MIKKRKKAEAEMCGIEKNKTNSAPFLKARALRAYLHKPLYGLDYILPGQPHLCFGVL